MTRCVLSARHSAILCAIFCATALLVAAAPSQPARAQGTVLQGVASVTDGDSLEIHGQRIRLHGIDAPESDQTCTDAEGESYRCGQRAALALSDRIGRSTITCQQRDIDRRYNRIVAVCLLGNLDLNAWMVLQGHALAYRRYSTDYVPQEALAKHQKRGIWAGTFVPPWDWRKGVMYRPDTHSKPAKPSGLAQKKNATRSSNCRIKGNISRRSGERIYHVPGQEYYAKTRISPGKGERWFCSEADARAAGWRRAKR